MACLRAIELVAPPVGLSITVSIRATSGFPVSDGFFISTSTFSPGGVPLEQDPFNLNLSLGYQGDTLESLDILDALGTYGFGGLTSFGFNLWANFPDNVAMEMDFAQMTIKVIPAPATLALLAPLALVRRRRRSA